MFRIILLVILSLHAFIHFLGFERGFGLVRVAGAAGEVTRSAGVLWLLTGLLLLLMVGLYWSNESIWPIVGIIGLGCSQYLIIRHWEDAKFGTIINILILLWVLPGLGDYWFDQYTQKVRTSLYPTSQSSQGVITNDDIGHLPLIVQRWLTKSGVVGKSAITQLQLSQSGKMRTNPDKPWMPFTALQYFNTSSHSFLWTAKVQLMPLVHLRARDLLYEGKGSTKIKLLSLLDVVNESPNHKMNTGAMIRYLAEMCWFPSGAVDESIVWEDSGPLTSKATLTLADVSVSGLFEFSEAGDILSFEAMRYRGGSDSSEEALWRVEMISHTHVAGQYLPNRCKVSWVDSEGAFHWLDLEVIDLATFSE